MNNTVKFSFIMPAYNAEKYIEDAINSVIQQTYNNWELIIINDGSTDNTNEILKKFENNNKIHIYSQKNSGSACAARAACIQYINGDYTQFLDSDDYISSDMLEKYVSLLNADNNIDIIIPNLIHINNQKNILNSILPPNNDYDQIIDGTEAFYLSLSWKIHGCNCVRSKIYKTIDYYTSKLINEDELSTRKILYSAKKIVFCNTTYYYRFNEESVTQKINPLRKYNYMETGYSIYNYALQNNMPEYILNMSQKNYYNYFFSNCSFFIDDLKQIQLNSLQYNYVISIMNNYFSFISIKALKKLYKKSPIQFIFLYLSFIISKKDIYNFSKILRILSIFKNCIKKIIK